MRKLIYKHFCRKISTLGEISDKLTNLKKNYTPYENLIVLDSCPCP